MRQYIFETLVPNDISILVDAYVCSEYKLMKQNKFDEFLVHLVDVRS